VRRKQAAYAFSGGEPVRFAAKVWWD